MYCIFDACIKFTETIYYAIKLCASSLWILDLKRLIITIILQTIKTFAKNEKYSTIHYICDLKCEH